VATRKPLVFDRAPGKSAAAKVQPPRSFARVEPPPEPPEYLTIPEPYALGQRVEAAGFRLGRVFNVCPCVCPLKDGFVYVVELDTMFKGSPFVFGHSSEVNPVYEDM
jgi:hypothetical protein